MRSDETDYESSYPFDTANFGPADTPALGVPRKARLDELDAHRGIAALGIVAYNVYQLSNTGGILYRGTPAYTFLNSLDAMVPWFFVLTAFLLFEPIARSIIEGRPRMSTKGFLLRRAVRLLPVYWVSITVVWFLRQQTLPGDWRDLVEHLTFTQVFDEKRIFYTIGPAWAVSVEVMFYLLLAVVATSAHRYCSRLRTRRSRIVALALVVTALGAVGAAWKAWSFYGDHRSTISSFTTWFGPMANLDVFAIGLGAAVVIAGFPKGRALAPLTRMALRGSAVAVLVAAFALRQANSFSGVYFPEFCALGFASLVAAAALQEPGDGWSRALANRPLLFIGSISYSVYLWHEPVMLTLRHWDGLVRQTPGAFVPNVVIVEVASLLVGWLSYLVIERPTGQLVGVFDRRGRLNPRYLDVEGIEWEDFRTGSPV